MKFSTLLTLTGALGLLFGALFFFAPSVGLAQYGAGSDAIGLTMASYFGSALIYLGLIFLALSRLALPDIRGVAWAAAIGEGAGLWISIRLQLSGAINSLGWSSVVLYGVLTIAFAWSAIRANATPSFPS